LAQSYPPNRRRQNSQCSCCRASSCQMSLCNAAKVEK
jgi:hypothetical protein